MAGCLSAVAVGLTHLGVPKEDAIKSPESCCSSLRDKFLLIAKLPAVREEALRRHRLSLA